MWYVRPLFFRKILFVVLVLISCCASFAKPVDKSQARQAGRGWLKHNRRPMGTGISSKSFSTEAFKDADGVVLYHVVHLDPHGFVVLSSDDEIEPVIAFSHTGIFDSTSESPLRSLLEKDMHGRLEAIKQGGVRKKRPADKVPGNGGKSGAFNRSWDSLIEAGEKASSGIEKSFQSSAGSVSDVRVDPFLQSEWGQGNAAGGYCYNYYTPNHYPAGCVATAMAQVMRYHSWPGSYNWSQMPFVPANGLTLTQRQTIGGLLSDVGLSVDMAYASGGSSASTSKIATALTGSYSYGNGVHGSGFSSSGDSGLWGMMNANLDAGLPVVLGISRTGGGHAVVADGYGYNGAMYHHINLGWDGSHNTWYQLPDISTGTYNYDAIDTCVYNVYPSGNGEIISGRITSLGGSALESATVRAYIGSTVIKQTTSDVHGIYALKKLSSYTQYRISVTKSGYVFGDQFATTGKSNNYGSSSGNKWGINFSASNAMPPAALDVVINTNSLNPIAIELEAIDDHQPDPPDKLSFTIVSLPGHGRLSEAGIGEISNVPYALVAYANSVVYTPCPYFGGEDSFSFTADDGGVAPTGGSSNTATVTVNVDNKLYQDYGLDTGWVTSGMVDTDYYDVRSEVIYLSNDVGAAKYLTDVALKITTLPSQTLNNWTIRMQHTNWTSFSDVVNMFITTGWTTVYQGDVTFGSTGWHNFHLSTPFKYNGTQNLLIDFSFNNSSTSADTGRYMFKQETGGNRTLALKSGTGGHGDPLNWDFWDLGGSYWPGNLVPSMKFVGTVPIDPFVGDFDASCDVRLPDMAILSAAWMSHDGDGEYNLICDIAGGGNGEIDLADLFLFASHWLQESP